MTRRRVVRAAGVLAMVAGLALSANPTQAHHEISFNDCGDDASPEPSPSTSPTEPGLTPPPDESPEPTPTPTGERTPAPTNCIPKEGEVIWGTRSLRFQVESDQVRPIKRVQLFILKDEEDLPEVNGGKPVMEWTHPEEAEISEQTYSFGWDSNKLTPRNGRYKIRIRASTWERVEEHQMTTPDRRNLRVDNPPAALPAPKVLATTYSTATLQWDKAKEPDVLSYTVYRAKSAKKPPYSAFKQIGVTTTNSFRDAKVTPGTYWYSVRVTRRSIVTPDKGISSALSPISGPGQVQKLSPEGGGPDLSGRSGVRRRIAFNSLSRPVPGRPAGVADAPFAYKLPYGPGGGGSFGGVEGGTDEPGTDPRGPVLPVAVGMFLVSSALAVGRMPY